MSVIQTVETHTGFGLSLGGKESLSGENRQNKAEGYSPLAAQNDLQAIEKWLAGLTDNTFKSYRKAAYRYLSWCVLVKGVCLSDVRLEAWYEFEAFLRSPPDEWILKGRPIPFGKPGYRFFRGPLDPGSVALDRRIIHGLYQWLVSANYLKANPLALIAGRGRKSTTGAGALSLSDREAVVKKERASANHRGKALSNEACKAIASYIKSLPMDKMGGQQRARYMWIFSLLTYTGLRASELIELTTAETFFEYKMEPGERRARIALHVLGKGQVYRKIPCRRELTDHFLTYRHTMGLEDSWIEGESIPLVLSLNKKHTAERAALRRKFGSKVNLIVSNERRDLAEPLTRQSLYRLLVTLYKRVSEWSDDPALASELRGKGVHSLRHTFGSNIVDKTSLKIAMELLGHADPATTSLYSHHDDSHLKDAIESLD